MDYLLLLQLNKNLQTRTHKKTATSRYCKKHIFGTPEGGSSNYLFSLKITILPKIVHMAPRASKVPVQVSKMTTLASKMIETLITLLIKIKTLAVKQTRRSEQTEKWHGGGICAQRTGYTLEIQGHVPNTHSPASLLRHKSEV